MICPYQSENASRFAPTRDASSLYLKQTWKYSYLKLGVVRFVSVWVVNSFETFPVRSAELYQVSFTLAAVAHDEQSS